MPHPHPMNAQTEFEARDSGARNVKRQDSGEGRSIRALDHMQHSQKATPDGHTYVI